jgi:molybdopterin-guanine dinucleotide biosynthesis protein A
VVTNSRERVKEYRSIVGEHVRLVVDQGIFTGPLVGALTGFSGASGTLSMLLPFDTPFVSQEVASLLFELCHSKAAVIPRWPNSQIEPLQAVYNTTLALEAAKAALAAGRMDMRGMIERIHGVRFVSTLVISQLDPDLQTFFNVNNRNDLVKASMMIKHRISI